MPDLASIKVSDRRSRRRRRRRRRAFVIAAPQCQASVLEDHRHP
jgi:hypothetical protein